MNIKFLADENISRHLVNLLRVKGYEVFWIREHKRGMSDLKIVETAQKEDLIIITADKDFGYLIYKQQLKCPGVVLIRVTDEKLQGSKIVGCLRKYKAKLAGNFVVITDKKIRIRPFHTAG